MWDASGASGTRPRSFLPVRTALVTVHYTCVGYRGNRAPPCEGGDAQEAAQDGAAAPLRRGVLRVPRFVCGGGGHAPPPPLAVSEPDKH
eukprot:gene10858-biopygen9366